MGDDFDWKKYWDDKSEFAKSDYTFDRGGSHRGAEIERLSDQEVYDFVQPSASEVIFDAGCGTGPNILMFHSRVKGMVGMDFVQGAVDRCRKRLDDAKITNVEVLQGSVAEIPWPDRSVDKILCMSVLQYLDDDSVRKSFREFQRILKDGGVLIMHVKNLSSAYHSTLRPVKKLKSLLGKKTKIENVRTFGWYARELERAGFKLLDYRSFNLFMLERMPKPVLRFFQLFELRNFRSGLLSMPFLRKRGADLKLKARLESRT